LHGWKDDEWNDQMKRDIGGGKLDDVLREIEETSRQDRPAKCRDIENASAFETRSAPALARCYPRSFTFYLGNPFPRFWSEFNRLPGTSNVSREKSFNFGCVIRFTRQCSSSRSSETSGQSESEIIIVLSRVVTEILLSGFGSVRTKTTTIS
jgi:hypothetical protein